MKSNVDSKESVFRADKRFNSVKVFSATMFADRGKLGDRVTEWIQANPRSQVSTITVTQSSDASFHCITLTVFYWDPQSPEPLSVMS